MSQGRCKVLKPQYVVEEGSLTIEIYGGYREIGGNCIVIRDGDRRIVFDNGIRFSVLRKYYRGKIQPLGPRELRNIGAIPPIEVFEDIDALYISHFHLDHLGLLGALPPGTRVYVPSTSILKIIEEWYRAVPTWLAELPPKLNIEVRELVSHEEDELGVIPILVSHSAYPSYALVYRGSDKTVFYSGDLRVSGPLRSRIDTLLSIEKVADVMSIDIALIEGTNIGGIETPIGPEEFKDMFNKILMESELVVVSVDPLDFEMLTALSELAMLNGRTIVVASARIVDIIPYWLESFKLADSTELAISTELEKPPPIPVQHISIRQDVMKNPGEYLLIQEPVGFLEMLRQMRLWGEKPPAGTTAVLTTPEPFEAEAEVEEEVLASWLLSLGIQIYRLRLSGHYYPYELKKILRIVKARKIVPIHTRHPRLMLALADKLKHN